ncbi:ELMO/CED-12 family-domain-containing protein [Morchella snyderi]|nr:ELMO/CED-12 family-domain-containing protein [Morchella snyderi]
MDNISELIERLSNDEDAVKKMAVFKLQSNIGDPSFAERFIAQGGLSKLRELALTASGNTLAYSLTSFSRLLELDKGWDYVNAELISRVVELIVTHPLVNILRGAMSILVSIVSHPHITSTRGSYTGPFGFRALKPAIGAHPQFLEMLVSRLSSADHALCANSLQLINSLMRDAITNDADNEWPRFIKRLQDLGVIKAVFVLMQSSALQDLAHPLLEFQALTKVLLRRWRDVKVDLEAKEHRIALKGLYLASVPEKPSDPSSTKKKHNPEKWRRLGFETESPAWEFGEVGFLGMMDLTDFVRKDEDGFRKVLLEQNAKTLDLRCPVARASITVTLILYHQFQVDRSDLDDAKTYAVLESRTNYERAFRPLLLQWSRLHTAGLQAFLRLWTETGASAEDFDKVAELVRVLIYHVVGQAPRTKEVQEVEEELTLFEYLRLRDLQMEILEQSYESAWGNHLKQVREELKSEAFQFVKEQRIRCLLHGAWFPVTVAPRTENGTTQQKEQKKTQAHSTAWRYVRLSHNRRYLHYCDYEMETAYEPKLEELPEKIDLSIVSSVVSNVVPASIVSNSSTNTLTQVSKLGSTKITIHGYPPHDSPDRKHAREVVLLTLHPQTHSVASEWLDGLLMLLNQQPITSETSKLINLVTNYGLKIRLLNVRYTDDFHTNPPDLPSREGVDDDYYYSLFV